MLSKQITSNSWQVFASEDDASLLGHVRQLKAATVADRTVYQARPIVTPEVPFSVFDTFKDACLSLQPASVDTLSNERPIEVDTKEPSDILKSASVTDDGPSRFSFLEID